LSDPITKANTTTSPLVKPTEDFDSFYQAFPKKVKREDAMRAWGKRSREKMWPGLDFILTRLEVQKASEEWTKDGGKYIPHPATWLNGGRWADEIGTRAVPTPPPVHVPTRDEIESRRIQEMHDRKYGKQPVRVALTPEQEQQEASRIQALWDAKHGKDTDA
jgi:hypothetical protein